MNEPVLLTDSQVQSFICNGFLRLDSGIPAERHADIEQKLYWALEREFHMGNNILPRIPDLYEVIDAPVVRGALISILGNNYVLHPHRAIHTSTPIDDTTIEVSVDANGPVMGKGSRAGSAWHQDAQSPLSRARHHHPRYLNMFYFPHDTPTRMGPTRIEAGSHLFANPSAPKHPVLPEDVKAGTVFLVQFDAVHAAFPNREDRTRYMLKFVFARTEFPAAPSWQSSSPDWHKPVEAIPSSDLTNTWSYIWHWMRGDSSNELLENSADVTTLVDELDEKDPLTQLAAIQSLSRMGEMSSSAIPKLLEKMKSRVQEIRLACIYALAAIGEPAVEPLVDTLLTTAGLGYEKRTLHVDEDGKEIPRDEIGPERRWNERAIIMEDAIYALVAVGQPAVERLRALLGHDDDWIKINASFALGEIGPPASYTVPDIAELLHHHWAPVVRQGLDALGAIGADITPALSSIRRLITTSNPDWQKPAVLRGWADEDQVRLNATFALLNSLNCAQSDLAEIQAILILALDDGCGYVPDVACSALERIGTPAAMSAAVAHLRKHRWDSSLAAGIRTF